MADAAHAQVKGAHEHRLRVIVVAVFLNEEEHLPVFLASMAGQTRLPDLVLLVDDGSTDRSAEIASAFAETREHFRYMRLPPRPPARDRLAAANELKAFQYAVDHIGHNWDVIAKMDADLDLSPRTIETLEQAFLADNLLGIAGARLSERQRDGTLKPMGSPCEHVEGATKFYRRGCWETIAPIPPILGWDTLDGFHARMHGWRTQGFDIPGGDPIHLRVMGSHGSQLRSFRRWGVCSYGYGAHPLQVAWYSMVLMRKRKPRLIGGIHYLAGWSTAWVRRSPRADPEIRAVVRQTQLSRVRQRLSRVA